MIKTVTKPPPLSRRHETETHGQPLGQAALHCTIAITPCTTMCHHYHRPPSLHLHRVTYIVPAFLEGLSNRPFTWDSEPYISKAISRDPNLPPRPQALFPRAPNLHQLPSNPCGLFYEDSEPHYTISTRKPLLWVRPFVSVPGGLPLTESNQLSFPRHRWVAAHPREFVGD